MSKSKGNVVDPDDDDREIRRRRAAALRDVRRAAGKGDRVDRRRARGQLALPGARLAARRTRWRRRSAARAFPRPATLELNDAERALRRKTHETIRRVTLDLDPRVHLNTAVSAMMELVNELYAFCSTSRCVAGRRAGRAGRRRRAAGDDRGPEGSDRGARPHDLAVRAAHGGGAVGSARPRRGHRRRRAGRVRRGGRQGRARSSSRCRSTARCAAG